MFPAISLGSEVKEDVNSSVQVGFVAEGQSSERVGRDMFDMYKSLPFCQYLPP